MRSAARTVLAPEVLNQLHPPAPQTAYTPWVVAWLLVYQRLHDNATLNDAVAHFQFSFPYDDKPNCKRCREHKLSANTGTYSSARSNLPNSVMQVAAKRVFDTIVAAYPPSWHDRRVFILDGTTLALAATVELTKTFTPESNQHGPSHWPVMHMVVAHELASGLAAAPQYGVVPAAVQPGPQPDRVGVFQALKGCFDPPANARSMDCGTSWAGVGCICTRRVPSVHPALRIRIYTATPYRNETIEVRKT